MNGAVHQVPKKATATTKAAVHYALPAAAREIAPTAQERVIAKSATEALNVFVLSAQAEPAVPVAARVQCINI